MTSSRKPRDQTSHTSRRDFIRYGLAATGSLAAFVYVKPAFTTFGAPAPFSAGTTFTPPPPCPIIDFLDFDKDPAGNTLAKGTIITTQFAAWGITVSGLSASGFPAMIFDSANPTGGDSDLRTPSITGGVDNNTALHNVLILSEDGSSSNPDDNVGGGTFTFWFSPDVGISYVDILDMDDDGGDPVALIRTYNAANNLIDEHKVFDAGDNSWQRVTVNDSGVARMTVWFKSSGALAKVGFFCPVD